MIDALVTRVVRSRGWGTDLYVDDYENRIWGSTMPNESEWLDDPRSFPAWELAQGRHLPVWLKMTTEAVPQLLNLLKPFPRESARKFNWSM